MTRAEKRVKACESITLCKPYGEHPAGSVLELDPKRVAWLRENGFEAEPADEQPKAVKPKAAKARRRPTEPDEPELAHEPGEES